MTWQQDTLRPPELKFKIQTLNGQRHALRSLAGTWVLPNFVYGCQTPNSAPLNNCGAWPQKMFTGPVRNKEISEVCYNPVAQPQRDMSSSQQEAHKF